VVRLRLPGSWKHSSTTCDFCVGSRRL